jgi:cellulose synthase (UDP-forming)
MLGMSIAGLIRYLGGKYGMALLFSSFIAFWLILNISNLLYAVYFMMGRKAYRASERFFAEIPVTFSYHGKKFSAVTKNISEGGFLFELKHPVYLPEDAPLEFTLKSEQYKANVRGKILYINNMGESWLYHVQLVPGMTELDTREYLQLVYDRQHSLPKSMNIWVTAFDDIVNNASQRLENKHSETRALPRIELNRVVRFEEGISATMLDFNFKFVLLRNLSQIADRLTLIPCNGIRIELEHMKKSMITPGVTLYRVVNWEELAFEKAFQKLLEDWILERRNGTAKPRHAQKTSAM